MRGFRKRLGLALCIAGGAISAVLHVATFITMVPPLWVIAPFAMLFGGILCVQAVQSEPQFAMRVRNWRLFGFALISTIAPGL